LEAIKSEQMRAYAIGVINGELILKLNLAFLSC